MSELCFITTCKGRLDHLRQTLPEMASQPRASTVLVDYSCPQGSGDWAELEFPAIKVVRVPGQAHYGPGRSRNAGAAAAQAPWLCFLDADVAPDPSFADAILPLIRPGHFYRPAPFVKELCGSNVVAADDFARVGGYDTVMQGWGWGDMDLFNVLRSHGLVEDYFPADLLRVISHPDDLRVEHYAIKDMPVSLTANFAYSRAKLDLMRLTGAIPSVQFRRELYSRIDRLARDWGVDGVEREFSVHFRREATWLGTSVTASLRYTIHPPVPPGGG